MITEKALTLVAIICNGLEQPCGLWMPPPALHGSTFSGGSQPAIQPGMKAPQFQWPNLWIKPILGYSHTPIQLGFSIQHSSLFIPSWGFSTKKLCHGVPKIIQCYLSICETNCLGDPNFKQSSCIAHPEIWWFTINKDIDKFGMMNNTFGIWLGLKISAIPNLMFVRFFYPLKLP